MIVRSFGKGSQKNQKPPNYLTSIIRDAFYKSVFLKKARKLSLHNNETRILWLKVEGEHAITKIYVGIFDIELYTIHFFQSYVFNHLLTHICNKS